MNISLKFIPMSQQTQIEKIKQVIINPPDNFKRKLFLDPDGKYFLIERGKLKQVTQWFALKILKSDDTLKINVFTANGEAWNQEAKEFVRVSEPILPDPIKGRHHYIDVDDKSQIRPYRAATAKGSGSGVLKNVIEQVSPGKWFVVYE